MTWANVAAKTVITGFTDAQKTSLLADLETAYTKSATAKAMIDTWLATAGHKIRINYVAGVYQGYLNQGKVELDPAYLPGLSYISDHGKAIQHSQLGALVHELGHALTGRSDNYNIATNYFMGDNVKYINTIWKELGLPLEVSYVAQAYTTLHTTNYQYTNGAEINGAITSDAAVTSIGGASNDLLIGGASANTLQSGGGNDWLYGAGGDDSLNGGAGNDTAVYMGKPTDYDIRESADGSWTVKNVRGAMTAGSDLVKNCETIQFGNKTYALKKGGMTFQTDFGLVIDTTGSMGSSIDSVKSDATSIVNALFASGTIDARIGVVGFKDTTNGEPSSVILKFTDQDSFADRKTAALAAINGISVGGGGDTPETDFDGLLTALDGSMGDWRVGAGVHRIALFTDAPAKDGYLAGAVEALAANLGSSASGGLTASSSAGSLSTFTFTKARDASLEALTLPGDGNPLPTFTSHDTAQTPDNSKATLEVYSIYTGSGGTDTSAIDDVARTTGGAASSASSGADLVKTLLKIIKIPAGLTLIGTPHKDTLVGGGGNDTIKGLGAADLLKGMAGNDMIEGGTGNDKIDGGAGDDTVDGGAGDDVLLGGSGNDTASYASAGAHGVTVNLSLTTAQKTGGAGKDTLSGFENLIGSTGADTLIGNGSANVIEGGLGSDTMDGGRGRDTASYAHATKGVHVSLALKTRQNTGGAGIDMLTNFENLTGSAFDDTLTGSKGDNVIYGGGGDDLIEGGLGADTIDGGAGINTVTYAHSKAGVTVYLGGTSAGYGGDAAGDKVVQCQVLVGSAFDDYLYGDGSDNVLEGGAGADYLSGGGAGLSGDTASYAHSKAGVTIDLSIYGAQKSGGDAKGDSLYGVPNVLGSTHADKLTGDYNNNMFTGGLGADTLKGGSGADTFVYRAIAEGGDRILDFATGSDVIEINHGGFRHTAAGVAVKLAEGAAPVAGGAGAWFLYNTSTGALSFDDDGVGAHAATLLATLSGHPTLAAGDFKVI